VIPRVLHRTVPEHTNGEVEQWWTEAVDLHPDWQHRTWRDPLNPDDFPLTASSWHRCTSGAQFAGLVRLEVLWHLGGVYIDSDFEPYRPFDPLLGAGCFAGYEDEKVVPDAVIGAEAGHPAIEACLKLALQRINSTSEDWRTGCTAWATGPGVTNTVLRDRCDVLLLPPAAFYPLHYANKHRAKWASVRENNPWSFGAHRWHHSWDGH
jgi:mannosyltransferase OCH1-like enzyme